MLRAVVVALVLVSTQACNFKMDSPQVQITPNVDLGGGNSNTDDYVPVSCSAGLPASMGGVVNSGEEAPILVQAIAGVGPYKVAGIPGSFNSQTTLTRTYSNSTTSNRIVTDTVQVIDNSGHTAQCQFNVTVLPANSPSNLACTLVADPSSPQVSQDFSLIVSGSGGTAPYVFNQLNLGSGGTIVSPLVQVSATQATGVGRYSTTGLRSASVQVRDAMNNTVSCSTSINVYAAPSLVVTASPSTSVTYTTPISLTASVSNFPSTPTYTFVTSESGILLTQSGSFAVVTVVDGLNHSNVPVTVTATAGSTTVNKVVTLSFTGSLPLNCSVSHPSGTYNVGDSIPFTVTANTGEALTITEFNIGNSGSIVGQTANSRTVQYVTSGTKTVTLRARSTSRPSVTCNNNALLQDSVVVQTANFTCDAGTNYNPSYINELFVAYATPNGASGTAWVESVRARGPYGNWFSPTIYGWYNSLSPYLKFNAGGSYTVELKLRDAANRTATCSTTHLVWY